MISSPPATADPAVEVESDPDDDVDGDVEEHALTVIAAATATAVSALRNAPRKLNGSSSRVLLVPWSPG
ncbi:hypothetical protein [Nakamurella leprariae]|uniref:Uncharacterized protein n=1 Tax=Nakamurella leprariae TaxID=2803911 RepID=A0A938YFJ5_9ACTN|nr:hypothetical protein [Nakamurella leprariae]MBM9467482.1 hypothetical protein [Nakamurella leprariae]